MNRVQGLIIKALNTADNNDLRLQAENTIFALLRQNPNDFFLTCAHIVADSNKQEQIRQSAASVMKALLLRRDDNNTLFWDLVNGMRRVEIKEILLANLVSPHIVVMRAGANIIAQIAAIEVTRGEWLEIVNALAQNSMHESLNIRRASITTLGFICEELKSTNANINRQTCEQILGSLLLGLREEGDIVEISLAALRESISFLRNILESPECSNKVFQFCFPLLNTEYAQRVYEILYEFGRHCYHLLPPYVETIKQFTIEHLRQRNQYSVRALELWDTIGTEYIKRAEELKERVVNENAVLRNFVQEAQEELLPEVMGSILILEEADIDLPDLREGAVKTLGTFVSCCGRELVEKVTDGVSRVINSTRPGERQASALLFSSLCFYPDKQYIQSIFVNGFTHLYNLIDDPNLIVKKNTLNGFLTLSEQYPKVFLGNKDIAMIVDHLLNLSKSHDQDVQVLSLGVLTNITDFLKEFECALTRQPDRILQRLIQQFTSNLNNSKKSEANEKIIIVIMNIVMATTQKNVLGMLIQHLISLYASYTNNNIKIIDLEIVHTQLIALIHTCVLALSKYTVDGDMRRKVVDLIDAHINIYGVESEGINLISAAGICFKKDFIQDQFQRYWKVITDGLMQIDQKPVFKAALQCISDIARSNDFKFYNRLTPVFAQLIQYVQSNIDRELKTEILRCFGDLSLGLKDHGEIYIDMLISISNECFQAVYRYSANEAEREYVQELKEALIEMYHCVIFAMNEQNKANDRLANHFPLVSTFIVRSCDVSLKPTVDYLKLCLYLIYDSGLFYSKIKNHKQMALNIMKSTEVTNLVNIIRKFIDRPDIRQLLLFIDNNMRSNWR